MARLAPSHLAEERSAGLCGRETHIQRNSDIYMQFKEVHCKHGQTTKRRSVRMSLNLSIPEPSHSIEDPWVLYQIKTKKSAFC